MRANTPKPSGIEKLFTQMGLGGFFSLYRTVNTANQRERSATHFLKDARIAKDAELQLQLQLQQNLLPTPLSIKGLVNQTGGILIKQSEAINQPEKLISAIHLFSSHVNKDAVISELENMQFVKTYPLIKNRMEASEEEFKAKIHEVLNEESEQDAYIIELESQKSISVVKNQYGIWMYLHPQAQTVVFDNARDARSFYDILLKKMNVEILNIISIQLPKETLKTRKRVAQEVVDHRSGGLVHHDVTTKPSPRVAPDVQTPDLPKDKKPGSGPGRH